MSSTKPFTIPKRLIWEAYKRVKANKGAAGVDRQSLEQFEENVTDNLYKIWNRMSSGSYMASPVKQVNIPKKNGGVRRLGVPTVSDRIAQMAVKLYIEPEIDSNFHHDSYGYRPNKSARQAVEITKRRCWRYNWMVEFDIKGAFDHIDHDLLMKAVKHHVKSEWVLLYIERWLKADVFTVEQKREARERGIPQGGVISPLLMNLFMHYAFDHWISEKYPACPFARYADDAVIHCANQTQAESLLLALEARLRQCHLQLHPDKTNIVYCKDSNRRQHYPTTQFTFLGFTFRPRLAVNKQGEKFTSFQPAVSNEALKSMRTKIQSWHLSTKTQETLESLSRTYNAVLRGWFEYYGYFYKTQMRKLVDYLNQRLARWARRKYKRLARHKRKSAQWLNRVSKNRPDLFAHWQYFDTQAVG